VSLKPVFQQERLTDILRYWIDGYKNKDKRVRGAEVVAIDVNKNTVVFKILVEEE